MTAKRFTLRNSNAVSSNYPSQRVYDNKLKRELYNSEIVDLLNELHEENEFLKSNYKDLVQFVKSKGYTLKDFISFIREFQSVGVNKEDWE